MKITKASISLKTEDKAMKKNGKKKMISCRETEVMNVQSFRLRVCAGFS